VVTSLPAELLAAVRALAASPDELLSLFPVLRPTADQLAADFDHWYRWAREEHVEFSKVQAEALHALAVQFAAMTVGVDKRQWTRDALYASPAWERVRKLAAKALATGLGG